MSVPTDLCRPNEPRRLAEVALAHFGRVDVLINNAGVVNAGVLVSRLTDDEAQATLTTNLLAPIELTRAVLPAMLEQGRGTIIFVDSVGGHIGIPSAALYSTSKFGLRGFAAALRRELKHRDIGVSVVSPGFIHTSLTETVRGMMPGVPMARSERVARAIVRLISHPRREVVVPRYYRLFIWVEQNLPFLVDLVAALYIKLVLVRQGRT